MFNLYVLYGLPTNLCIICAKCFIQFLLFLQDSDLAEFLAETSQYISLLDIGYKSFVQALLQIDWMNRSSEVISTYKLFLQKLAYMQTLHTNIVINHLVELFKPGKFYI